MSGMYPNNQNIEIFGEEVNWPGVDVNGKFTNGSFSDPLVKPSFIPAETINLILDNLSELLISLGKTPNSTDPSQLKEALTPILALKAPLENPVLIGMPKVPDKTSPAIDDGTLIATEAQVALKANDSDVVKLTGNQTIAGTKTFSTSPAVPSKSTAAENNPTTVATEAQVALKANLASPALTGTPTAPTASITQSNLATAKNIVNMEMLINLLFPIGKSYTQGPNDPTPVEAGYPGNWQDWTQRAELYGLSTVNPSAYRAYESNLTNVTAGEYILWNVPNTGRFMVVRAKVAMAEIPAVLNPINWWFPEDGSTNYGRSILYAERRKVQPGDSAWLDSDKAFCNEVLGNNAIPGTTVNTTYYVHELITCAGLFPSFEGGNRPPFVSSGVAGDRIRNITGTSPTIRIHVGLDSNGAFSYSNLYSQGGTSGSGCFAGQVFLDPSRVVPTGVENSPQTLSLRKWRRVS